MPRSVRSIPPCRKVTFALSQSMRLPRTRWSLISWRSTLRANDAEAVLGLNKKSIRMWARKARKHKDGLVMVPVYFVDRPATDGRDGEQVRIAVNGQTGRAAAGGV